MVPSNDCFKAETTNQVKGDYAKGIGKSRIEFKFPNSFAQLFHVFLKYNYLIFNCDFFLIYDLTYFIYV